MSARIKPHGKAATTTTSIELPSGITRRLQHMAVDHDVGVEDLLLDAMAMLFRYHAPHARDEHRSDPGPEGRESDDTGRSRRAG